MVTKSASLFLFAVLLVAPAASSQGWIFNPTNGHFYRTTPFGAAYQDARDFAASLGGYLVAIHDAAEQAFVEQAFGGAIYWIGLTGRGDCEGWTRVSGVARVEGFAPEVQLPSSGSQLLEMPTAGGEVNPPPSIGQPAAGPLAAGQGSEARLQTVALTSTLAVDWGWVTGELPESSFNDFAQMQIIDPADSTVIATVFHVDTFSPRLVFSGGAGSGIDGGPPLLSFVPRTRSSVRLPESYVGQPILISVVSGNVASSVVVASPDGILTPFGASTLFLDDVRFEPEVPYPGSGELALASAVGLGADPTSGFDQDVKTASAGDLLTLAYASPSGAFDFLPPIVAATPFTTGAPPAGPALFPEVHLDPANLAILVDGTVPTLFGPAELLLPTGNTHVYLVPTGLAGLSVLVQVLVPTPIAANGFFAVSDGQEFQLQP